MPELALEIARDPRGSLVHVRSRQSGECVGCIEVGLYEIVRALIRQEAAGSGCVWRPPPSCGVERAPDGVGEPAGGEIGERSG